MSIIYEIASAAAAKAAGLLIPEDRSAVLIRYGKSRSQTVIFRCPPKKTAASSRRGPVVVYFHHSGGILSGGSDLPAAAARLTAKGYCVAVCCFRRFPMQIDDSFSALEAVTAYMAETGLGRRVILAGDSNGAISAALCALDADARYDRGIDCEIAGLLSVGGRLDLRRALKRMPWAKVALITMFSRCDASEIAGYSPLSRIADCDPIPVLCLHGKYDNIVPYAGAMRFVRRMNERIAESGDASSGRAVMIEIKDPVYRHIRLTDGLWLENPKKSPLQREVYEWMEKISNQALKISN